MMLKWIIISSTIFLSLAVVTAKAGQKSIHSETYINASPKDVWQALFNLEKYEKWNPVMRPLSGKMVEGGKIRYHFIESESKSYELSAEVKKVTPQSLINQRGGYPLILKFDHKYILEPSGLGTKFIIHEEYNGIWVHFWDPSFVQHLYDKIGVSLKTYLENEE
ncbi:SRPBCC family protein [Curvivirga sp.]|uniref:SRPBCC family protein n=1 Tax=Curvivirga sp. TaxID=2856848 RepID=UPI003B5C0105